EVETNFRIDTYNENVNRAVENVYKIADELLATKIKKREILYADMGMPESLMSSNDDIVETATTPSSPQIIVTNIDKIGAISTNDKEDSFKTPLPIVEFENQFSVLELKFYTRYKKYIDDVRKEDSE
ncbi:26853_t:CDS:2, partial [Dentiscutata erythropus]